MSSSQALIDKIEKDLAEEEKLKTNFLRQLAEEKTQRRKGFFQRLQKERREASLDGVVLKAQEVANLQSNEIEQEERLASELSIIRQQEIRDEKLRQHLRENSHELKELEKQLRNAYVNKALVAQIADNEARRAEEQMLEQKARETMLAAIGSIDEMEKRDIMFEKQMKEEYKRNLQDQIINKERLRQEEYMMFMKEKKIFDDTIKKIRDEEEREMKEKLLMKQKKKEEMEQFYAARELWKAKERILIDRENQRFEAIARQKEQQEAEKRLAMKNVDTSKRDEIIKKMTQEILAQNRKKEERLDILNILSEKVAEEKENEKARRELEKDWARREEARVEFQKLLQIRDKKIKDEKELDARFVEQMNLKIEEEEKREREKEYNKRQNRVNDRKYNEEKIKQNIQKHAENLKLTQMAIAFEEEEERKRAQLIEEERIRILKEHAPHLLGYFPKGCLKEKDLELLGITSNSPLPEASRTLLNK